ncbi:hypothetical protein RDV89_10200 [Nocardioides zeae]|uniref:Uncharacterized protein n=1 Tax=Nocardioides imazamoxiresistens TaxID=3231893 RepID=A0ABU3PW23_9ACTN|nr:hypothetical protein [Nocardioides zeae]MDT9593439.1 hypothetical protein [Nocardioides zeae]
MLPDVEALRALAQAYRAAGGTLRSEATALGVAVESTPWHGLAAEAARAATHEVGAMTRARADEHDEVAAALESHALEVARTLAAIAAVRERFLALAASVGATVVDAAGATLSTAGELLETVGEHVPGALGDAVGAVGELAGDLGGLLGGDDAEEAAAELRERIERIHVPGVGDLAWLDLDLPELA